MDPYLISPLVNHWHVNVIDEHCHLTARRWPVRASHTLVHVTLNRTLKNYARR